MNRILAILRAFENTLQDSLSVNARNILELCYASVKDGEDLYRRTGNGTNGGYMRSTYSLFRPSNAATLYASASVG